VDVKLFFANIHRLVSLVELVKHFGCYLSVDESNDCEIACR
jgi:hypothetical protein